MSALAALLRVERRAFLRARRRSALFVALVALPCAALVAAAALQRTVLPSDEQARAERFGEHALAAVGGTHTVLAGFADTLLTDEAHELATLADGSVVLRFDAHDERVATLAAHARRRGLTLERRVDATSDTSFETLVLHVVSVFGFAVAALVVGAAVAVGLRRRTLEFARLAACGASANLVGAALALATAGAALFASLVGVPLGIGAAFALLPFVEAWTEREHGALAIAWDAVLAAPLLGVLAALAAAVPSIARIVREVRDVRVARDRPPRPPSARRGWFGVALFVGGVAVVFTAQSGQAGGDTRAFASLAGGSLLGLVGLACTVGVCVRAAARLSARAPLAWRVAVRDAARSSGRSAAAALAVLAGLASATAVASLGAAVLEVARANGDGAAQRDPLLELALLAACVLGLGVVAVASALDAAEGARDTAVFVANGAEPRTLLALSGARAAHLALVGGVLSVPAGLLPALGLVRAADVPLAFAVPWREIAAALVVLPVLAFAVGAAVSALVSRRATTIT